MAFIKANLRLYGTKMPRGYRALCFYFIYALFTTFHIELAKYIIKFVSLSWYLIDTKGTVCTKLEHLKLRLNCTNWKTNCILEWRFFDQNIHPWTIVLERNSVRSITSSSLSSFYYQWLSLVTLKNNLQNVTRSNQMPWSA